MLMFSGHTVGRQMCVVGNNGTFFLQVNITLFLTGISEFSHSLLLQSRAELPFVFPEYQGKKMNILGNNENERAVAVIFTHLSDAENCHIDSNLCTNLV